MLLVIKKCKNVKKKNINNKKVLLWHDKPLGQLLSESKGELSPLRGEQCT